jgi:hypothetical protein
LNNDAIQKAMLAHCKVMAKAHEAAADCHQSLSECFKSEQAQGLHKGMKDMHADLHSCHKSMSESYGKLGDACKKSAGGDNDIEKIDADAISTKIIDTLRREFGEQVIPTAVRKVFDVADPTAGSGLTLINRSGGPSVPTPAERIDPAFRSLFTE